MPSGRSSSYTPEIAAEICGRIAKGESLRTICKPEGMPAASTVCQWLSQHPSFVEQYARAREAQADALAEECLEIADDASRDYVETPDGPRLNAENVQRSRLRVDTRKWYAGKVAPKKYGDRVEIGGDKESPLEIVHRIERVIVDALPAPEPGPLRLNGQNSTH